MSVLTSTMLKTGGIGVAAGGGLGLVTGAIADKDARSVVSTLGGMAAGGVCLLYPIVKSFDLPLDATRGAQLRFRGAAWLTGFGGFIAAMAAVNGLTAKP